MPLSTDKTNISARLISLLSAAPSSSPTNAAAAAAQTAADIYHLRDSWANHSVQVINPGGATVKLWRSLDAVNWVQLGADITTSTIVDFIGYSLFYVKATRDNTNAQAVTVLMFSTSTAD